MNSVLFLAKNMRIQKQGKGRTITKRTAAYQRSPDEEAQNNQTTDFQLHDRKLTLLLTFQIYEKWSYIYSVMKSGHPHAGFWLCNGIKFTRKVTHVYLCDSVGSLV